MKPLVEKVLRSGLIDRATASLMEKYGMLEAGASDQVNEDALKNATKEHLTLVAEELAEEVEKEHRLQETYLDLERLRWPVTVRITDRSGHSRLLSAVIDRQGRYYFRFQDVDPDWFAPGYSAKREDRTENEIILEAQTLYIDDNPVAIQVTASE